MQYRSRSITMTLIVYHNRLSKRGRYIRHCVDIAGWLPSRSTQSADRSRSTSIAHERRVPHAVYVKIIFMHHWAFIILQCTNAQCSWSPYNSSCNSVCVFHHYATNHHHSGMSFWHDICRRLQDTQRPHLWIFVSLTDLFSPYCHYIRPQSCWSSLS
jgi:hypothetical protein